MIGIKTNMNTPGLQKVEKVKICMPSTIAISMDILINLDKPGTSYRPYIKNP